MNGKPQTPDLTITLDDGRLTDGQGRTVDFSNSMIIMTSNMGAEFLVGLEDGKAAADVKDEVMAVVRAHFRPEFLNRLDEIILFERLKKSDMAGIVEIQLRHLRDLLRDRRIDLEMQEDAINWLADRGYDPAYGARPLKRVIQSELQDKLAERILAGDIHDGMRVTVTAAAEYLLLDAVEKTQPADNDNTKDAA